MRAERNALLWCVPLVCPFAQDRMKFLEALEAKTTSAEVKREQREAFPLTTTNTPPKLHSHPPIEGQTSKGARGESENDATGDFHHHHR